MNSGRSIAPPGKRADKAEKEAAAPRLWKAVQSGASVMFDWDLSSGRVRWSDDPEAPFAGSRALPREAEDGHALELAILPEDRAARRERLAAPHPDAGLLETDYRVRDASGITWVNERARVECDAKGHPCRLTGVMQQVSERKEREVRLELAAHRDALTGHFTRQHLRERIGQVLADAARPARREGTRPGSGGHGVGGGYLTLAVDHAARILESFGPEALDAVVQEVGRRILLGVRGADAIGRVAPAQFGILVSQGGKRELKALGARLLGQMRDRVVATPEGPVPVTLSAGAILLREASDADAALYGGEEALMAARRAGGDRYSLHAPALGQSERRRDNHAITEMVLSALAEGRLKLAFQPMVSARNGQVMQYEALLRMIGPDGEPIAAGQFMPAAERLGLARLIDRRTLDLAMTELAQSRTLRLALNVSALTAADAAWLPALEKHLAAVPDAAQRLTVEITETAVLDNFHTTEHFVAALRALGCAVALDDFGAGYTSFRHLRGLAVNVVKIDRAFVTDLARRPDNRLVVRAVRDLAQGLGLSTVAEGVESAEDAGILAELGVDLLQGYHLGRPAFDRPWRRSVPLRLVAGA